MTFVPKENIFQSSLRVSGRLQLLVISQTATGRGQQLGTAASAVEGGTPGPELDV